MIRAGEPLGADRYPAPDDDNYEARWNAWVEANEDDIETAYKTDDKLNKRHKAEFGEVWTSDDLEAAYYQILARRERQKKQLAALDKLIDERTRK